MKFSIVTPSYNSERFIAQTIAGVLSQEGDFEIEYILQDGGSTDKTVDIFEEYRAKNTNPKITMAVYIEKDTGMYDALNKGFAHATGDIYAYINSDDYYLPGAFATITGIRETFPEIQWLKGMNCVVNETGVVQRCNSCYLYRRDWIQRGIYGRYAPFIQQESVFWTMELWKKAGGFNPTLRYAGDYALWISFSKYEKLWSFNKTVSVFRRHATQLSAAENEYRCEQEIIYPKKNNLFEWRVKLFFWCVNHFAKIPIWNLVHQILFYKNDKCIIFEKDTPTFKKSYGQYVIK